MLRPTLLALAFAATFAALPASAQDEGEAMTSAPVIGASLTEKIWVQPETESGLPGAMKLFLSEGTMLQTSCWEGYRLSSWQMVSDTTLSWEEDTQTITAEIVELNEAELILALQLVGGEVVEQHFEAAPVPFVCPDMPR